MPYIAASDRKELNNAIDALVSRVLYATNKDEESVPGVMNYCICRFIIEVIRQRFGTIRYKLINRITGVLTDVLTEFNRRVVAPYEDRKAKENGDLEWDSIL